MFRGAVFSGHGVYIIVCGYVYLVVFVLFFLFCSISFSTLIPLVGSFDM